ncbi:MAG TPA: hypothetical protein DD490_23150, partial [Acidobacteria bacterium]|nr:hypothetical protein [Acidobacteriota bacterium]
ARAILATPDLPPHRAVEALEGLAGEELLLLMAQGDDGVRGQVRRVLTELRALELNIRGADLVAAGFAQGPEIGRTLAAVRRARLDGLVEEGREAELAFALGTRG